MTETKTPLRTDCECSRLYFFELVDGQAAIGYPPPVSRGGYPALDGFPAFNAKEPLLPAYFTVGES